MFEEDDSIVDEEDEFFDDKHIVYWPAIATAVFCVVFLLATLPWVFAIRNERLATKCTAWGPQSPQTGERQCVSWSGKGKIMR